MNSIPFINLELGTEFNSFLVGIKGIERNSFFSPDFLIPVPFRADLAFFILKKIKNDNLVT